MTDGDILACLRIKRSIAPDVPVDPPNAQPPPSPSLSIPSPHFLRRLRHTNPPCLLLAIVALLLNFVCAVDAALESGNNGGRRLVEVYHPFPYTPEGLIRQLTHAQQAVNKGSLAMALVAKDGVVLVGSRRNLSPLLVGPTPKIGQMDQHIAYVMAGLVPDGRYVVRRGRLLSQQHWFVYGEEVGLPGLLMDLSKVLTSAHYRLPPEGPLGEKKGASFFEEIRPKPSVDPIGDAEAELKKEGLPARYFGVGFLFAGPLTASRAPTPVDEMNEGDNPASSTDVGTSRPTKEASSTYPPWTVYEMGPSGLFVRWSARAIGERGDRAEALLESRYRPGLTLEDCQRLAIHICDSVMEDSSSSRVQTRPQHRHEQTGRSQVTDPSRETCAFPDHLEMASLTRDKGGRARLRRLSDAEVRQLREDLCGKMGLVETAPPSPTSP